MNFQQAMQEKNTENVHSLSLIANSLNLLRYLKFFSPQPAEWLWTIQPFILASVLQWNLCESFLGATSFYPLQQKVMIMLLGTIKCFSKF